MSEANPRTGSNPGAMSTLHKPRQILLRHAAAVAVALIPFAATLPSALRAQTPAPTPPPVTPVATQGGATAPEKDPALPTLKNEGDYIAFSMSETNGIEMKEFIKWAHELTGKRIVFTETEIGQSTNGSKINFLGTFRFKKETFARDFFSLFQTMLYIKGFAIVPRGTGDLELLEIVFMAGQRSREVTSSARYIDSDRVIEFKDQTGVPIITTAILKHINAQLATSALRPFFATSGGAGGPQGGVLLGNTGNNSSLLLQGFGPQVFDALTLLKVVDMPIESPDIVTHVQKLEFAAPEEIEPILTEVLDNRQKVRAQAMQEAGVQGQSGAPLQTGQSQMKVVVNPALRAVILSGTSEQVREALDLVARLDVLPEPVDGTANIIRLKNVLADDLRSTLDAFVKSDQQAETQAQQGAPGAGAARRPRQTVIQAHKESNSLVVSASQTKYKQLMNLIDNLDRRQPQVLIEAALVELTTGDGWNLGTELGLLDIKDNGDFTRPFGFTSFGQSNFNDTDGDGLPDTRLPNFDTPLAGLTGGIIRSNGFAIPVLINALATNDRANILSIPSVLVNNNSPATVKTEESRPTTTSSQGTSTTQSSNGAPRTAGITLEISPTISPNNYLRLNVNLSISRFVGKFDPNSVSGGGITLERAIKTQVTMPSGDTMVIGGVIEDTDSHSEGGIPILKDLPLIGFLFRSTQDIANKTNLYFFVTPTILDEDDFDDLWQLSLQKKMEADNYIGSRRLQLVDRQWHGSEAAQARTLEDSGATVEDVDRQGENELPRSSYSRSAAAKKANGVSVPSGPNGPPAPAVNPPKNTAPTGPSAPAAPAASTAKNGNP